MKNVKIKNEHIFKNKWQMVIYIILFAVMFYLFIYLGNKDYKTAISDNERMHLDFPLVEANNVFKYVNSQDTYINLTNGRHIILFGFKNNEWVNNYAKVVNEAAIENNIEEVLYYDFYEDRNENNGYYESIVNYLSNYITYTDTAKADIYAPTLIVIENGKITYFDDETAFMKGNISPDEYWNELQVVTKKNELEVVFKNFLGME